MLVDDRPGEGLHRGGEGLGGLLARSLHLLLSPALGEANRAAGHLHARPVLAEETVDAVDELLPGQAPAHDAGTGKGLADDRTGGAAQQGAVQIEERRAAGLGHHILGDCVPVPHRRPARWRSLGRIRSLRSLTPGNVARRYAASSPRRRRSARATPRCAARAPGLARPPGPDDRRRRSGWSAATAGSGRRRLRVHVRRLPARRSDS